MEEKEEMGTRKGAFGQYQTFVLRCSQFGKGDGEQKQSWRFYIENTRQPGHKKILASLEGLMNYLKSELDDGEPESDSRAD